jgi:AraC-like DNA-binding protein
MMKPGKAPLLERQKILHSHDAEELHAFFDTKGFRVELPRRSDALLDLRVNCALLPGVSVGYLQYGPAAAAYAKAPGSDYLVTFPLQGRLEASVPSRSIVCNPLRAVVISYPPLPSGPIRSEEGCSRINLTITGEAMRRQLATLLGRPPVEPLIFAPELTLSEGHGRRLAWYLRLAIADFDAADALPWDTRTTTQFEQVVLTGLLLSQPNNYSAALEDTAKPAAPRDIKRAVDYLEGHLDLPVTIADLVVASQVPGRTLFQHFHDFKGTSPMRYLREARFERVHCALLAAEPEESITAIATHWGFTHLGRFAVGYRRRFGERPSDTLRRKGRMP